MRLVAFLDRKNLLKGDTKLPAQYDRKLLKRLQALTREELDAELGDVLQGREINAIFTRRDKILEHQQKLVDERGEARVMFN